MTGLEVAALLGIEFDFVVRHFVAAAAVDPFYAVVVVAVDRIVVG